MKEILIVGAGITGAYLARNLAEKDYKVKVVDKKDHVAGHIYDYKDSKTDCMVQKFGPHIFHTSNQEVWDWANRFTDFIPFKLTNKVYFHDLDKWLIASFGTHTAKELLSDEEYTEYLKAIVEEFPCRVSATVPELLNAEHDIIRKFANILWENDYRDYTSKQWGLDPKDVDPSVLKRVPVYLSHYERYFTDTYEGIPAKGYTQWVKNILNHKNIELELNKNVQPVLQDNKVIVDNKVYDLVIYTGPIEEIFNHQYGDLKYRSLRFEYFETPMFKNIKMGDPCVHVYPSPKYEYTRITYYGLLPQQPHLETQIGAKEYSFEYNRHQEGSEPYYPVNTTNDKVLYEQYKVKTDNITNLLMAGRLGQYKYYNMDKAIEAAMELVPEIEERLM